jgi:hypothetical protein
VQPGDECLPGCLADTQMLLLGCVSKLLLWVTIVVTLSFARSRRECLSRLI